MNKAPRISSSQLQQYVGQQVRIVGKIVSENKANNFMTLEASDHGQISIQRIPNASNISAYVEIIGIVNQDLTVSEMTSTGFGDEFDLDAYNRLLQLAPKFPQII